MLLGIDTSGAVSVAVADLPTGGGAPVIRSVRSDDRARHHDEVLLDLVDRALADAGARRADLSGIVAGRGPGPFTGLRVGLVVARTLAAVLDVPLHGVCSLDALAHEAAAAVIAGEAEGDSGRGIEGGPVSVGVALDARRREVYHAIYRAAPGTLVRTEGPGVAAPAQVAASLTACDLLVGSGTALYPELLPATVPIAHVDAGHLLRVAALELAARADLSDTDPLYLREPDAAKPTARKSALGRR